MILYQRYIEGLGVNELAEMLAIGRRQARRDHSRALQALSNRLWELTIGRERAGGEASGADTQPAYSPHLEPLNLSLVLLGVAEVMSARLLEEDLDGPYRRTRKRHFIPQRPHHPAPGTDRHV